MTTNWPTTQRAVTSLHLDLRSTVRPASRAEFSLISKVDRSVALKYTSASKSAVPNEARTSARCVRAGRGSISASANTTANAM